MIEEPPMAREQAQSWDEVPPWPGWVLIGLTAAALCLMIMALS